MGMDMDMDRDDLMIKLRALLLDIIGVEIYYIDTDADLRAKQSFDQGSEELLIDALPKEFNVDIDLSIMKPLTLEKIADFIMQEQSYDLKGGDSTKERSKIEREKKLLEKISLTGLLFDRLILNETNSGPVGRRCSI
jgi:hypothetical protein